MAAVKHPMQPIGLDAEGVPRFKANEIVKWLHNSGRIDLNEIAAIQFPQGDVDQFWQLLGYSVSGYGELSFTDPDIIEAADKEAARLTHARRK